MNDKLLYNTEDGDRDVIILVNRMCYYSLLIYISCCSLHWLDFSVRIRQRLKFQT